MPLPTPNSGEDQGAFVSRCMANEKMRGEYPNKLQRVAVCESQWNRRKKSLLDIVNESIKKLSGNCGCNKR